VRKLTWKKKKRAGSEGNEGGKISKRLRDVYARVVDEEINAAKVLDGSFSHCHRHILFADVTVNQNKVGGRFLTLLIG